MSSCTDIDEKIQYYINMFETCCDNADINYKLGVLYLQRDTQRLSDGVKAEFHLRESIRHGNNTSEVFYHLALAIRMQGTGIGETVDYFRKAIELNPDLIIARRFLAQQLVIENDMASAHVEMLKAYQLDPENVEIKTELNEVEEILKLNKTAKTTLARWPVKLTQFSDIDECIRHFVISDKVYLTVFSKKSLVCTFGSCFAGNVARVLRKFDVQAENITFGEYINSTFANLAYMRWINGESISNHLANRLEEIFEYPREYYKRKLQAADLVVITLGVAPVFFSKDNQEFVLPKANQINMRLFASRYIFRTTTPEENLDNLLDVIQIIRQLSPQCNIVVTLSPVPLSVTFEYESPIVADCVSKSVLRVAVELLMQKNIEKLVYWPAFEIVRWVGAYRGDVYGAEDGSTHHVSEHVVDAIIKSFIENCGSQDLLGTSI